MFLQGIFYFLVLIFSIIAHEVAHGVVAEREGDPTARLLGRITLNPLKHIDWFGSVVLPLLLILSNVGFVIGWAKPVPYNPNNVRNGRISVAKISVAGVLTNIGIALIAAIAIRILGITGVTSQSLYDILSIIVLVNLVLAIFNILPIPPLDGFNFLASVLPARYEPRMREYQRYGLIVLIAFLFFGWQFISPLIFHLYTFLTGIAV